MSDEFTHFLAGRSAAMTTIAPGIETPLRFSTVEREHFATRRAAGLFDFSFMCCIEITGPGSTAFLHALQTRTLDAMAGGRIAYTLLLRDDGTVIIDATVWRFADNRYWLFTGRRADFDYVAAVARDFDVTLVNRSGRQAVIAVQGSTSIGILEMALNNRSIRTLPWFGFISLPFAGVDCRLARIGYSGERGYELIIDNVAAPALWQALLAAGANDGLLECGFEATNALRIEAGHILFSSELAAPVRPAELSMDRLIDFHRSDFRGASAIHSARRQSPARRLVGLLPGHRIASAASGPPIVRQGRGALSSAAWSPLLEKNLALGFVHADDAYPGTMVKLACGTSAQVARLPFYDPGRVLLRRGD
ncbi:MAG: glycine cleavage system protein [Betaproteobacteria bacterium]|nr:glycine cleavage system protein [Betaproteobacteria bacterium]